MPVGHRNLPTDSMEHLDDGSWVFDRTRKPRFDWNTESVKPTGDKVTDKDREKATGFHVPETTDAELMEAFDAVVMAMRVRHQNPHVWKDMRAQFAEVFGDDLDSAVHKMPLAHVKADAAGRLAEQLWTEASPVTEGGDPDAEWDHHVAQAEARLAA